MKKLTADQVKAGLVVTQGLYRAVPRIKVVKYVRQTEKSYYPAHSHNNGETFFEGRRAAKSTTASEFFGQGQKDEAIAYFDELTKNTYGAILTAKSECENNFELIRQYYNDKEENPG